MGLLRVRDSPTHRAPHPQRRHPQLSSAPLRRPGFIASPPCQTFSAAGKGAGRAALDTVYQLAKTLEARQSVDFSVFSDERTGLVLDEVALGSRRARQ